MTGKVAVITGASLGIGAGLMAGYRERGWAVAATARAISPSGDPGVLTVEADIADPATAGRIIGEALERFGRIDILVNNAGACIAKPFTDYTTADYAAAVGVNLTGFFWVTQRAIAEMASRYGGHVVNVTATSAEVADSGTPAVLAALTKRGLAAATRSLAIDRQVRFTVDPGSPVSLAALAGVCAAEQRGTRVTLHSSDPDATVTSLVGSGLRWSDLEVGGLDLEASFLRLMGERS